MPKPMMMVLHVEEIAFGSTFRRLRNMPGIVRIDLDGEPDEKPNGHLLEGIVPGSQKRYRGGGGIAKNGKGSDAGGDSAKCIVLDALASAELPVASGYLTDLLESKGKSRKTFANVSHVMRRDKLARKNKTGWVITRAGRKYYETECKLENHADK